MGLKNKVAIVTGAAMGIGLGIVEALAKEKCQVVVADLNLADCQKVARKLARGGAKVLAVRCDVSKKTQVNNLFKQTIKKFGRVDILVNNAGIYPFVPFNKMKEADWDRVMSVNLKGVFFTCQQAVKYMSSGSRIINISSIASVVAFEGLVHYCASKGAINSMVRALALELAPRNILVNGIAPGAIQTPGASRGVSEEVRKQMTANIPLAHMGKPEDIAGAVVFLASDQSSYITGQTIVVDGGWVLR